MPHVVLYDIVLRVKKMLESVYYCREFVVYIFNIYDS